MKSIEQILRKHKFTCNALTTIGTKILILSPTKTSYCVIDGRVNKANASSKYIFNLQDVFEKGYLLMRSQQNNGKK